MKFSDETGRKFEERMKLVLFSSYNSLINRNILRTLIYTLLLLIEFLEILSYVLPASNDDFRKSSLFLYDFLYYMNVLFIIKIVR